MKKDTFYQCLLLAACVVLSGCMNTQPQKEPGEAALYKECSDPRAQFCTREYRPVCATRDTGVRCVTTPCASTELKTYSNACTACADSRVLGYRPGACTVTPK